MQTTKSLMKRTVVQTWRVLETTHLIISTTMTKIKKKRKRRKSSLKLRTKTISRQHKVNRRWCTREVVSKRWANNLALMMRIMLAKLAKFSAVFLTRRSLMTLGGRRQSPPPLLSAKSPKTSRNKQKLSYHPNWRIKKSLSSSKSFSSRMRI